MYAPLQSETVETSADVDMKPRDESSGPDTTLDDLTTATCVASLLLGAVELHAVLRYMPVSGAFRLSNEIIANLLKV